MKYRMLTHEELSELSEEFKQFLIVNGVHSDEWGKMNETNQEQAIALVELFSDTVLQKVYEKIKYLEFRMPESCLVFRLGKESIDLISLNRKQESEVDLSTPESIHVALSNHADQLTMFRSSKTYKKNREDEIHQMLEQGCLQSSEEFWTALNKVLD